MKYFGCIFVLVGVLIFSREYISTRKRRVDVLTEILSLVTHLHREISRCVCTPRKALCRFESPILTECGFLERVRAGESLSSAFSMTEGVLHLAPKVREYVSSLFNSVGTGSYKEECKKLSFAVGELENLIKGEREELMHISKLTPTVTAAFAIGFVLLVI